MFIDVPDWCPEGCPDTIWVWATLMVPEGPSLLLRVFASSWRHAEVGWGPQWPRDRWGVPGRDTPSVILSEALPRIVADLGCEELPASFLADVLRRLADPAGVWNALWIMGS